MDLESGVGGCPPAATLTPRLDNGSPSLKRVTSIRRVGGPSTIESRDRERSPKAGQPLRIRRGDTPPRSGEATPPDLPTPPSPRGTGHPRPIYNANAPG